MLLKQKRTDTVASNAIRNLNGGQVPKNRGKHTDLFPSWAPGFQSGNMVFLLWPFIKQINSEETMFYGVFVGGRILIWGFPKIGVPQNGRFIWKTLLKWMIWGYHHLRKHPFIDSNVWFPTDPTPPEWSSLEKFYYMSINIYDIPSG